ncbi:MAG: Swt1 family HEPN domain-containing protein [Jatrophihabitans sp.]
MGDVYELLYCLENSIRELIESTLREAFAENWWADGVDDAIRKSAEKRRDDDAKARWHGPRGESLLSYVDFPQYADIILRQWVYFEALLGDRAWVQYYFEELNRTRRALAHTGRLTEADVERMEVRIRDWLRVVG